MSAAEPRRRASFLTMLAGLKALVRFSRPFGRSVSFAVLVLSGLPVAAAPVIESLRQASAIAVESGGGLGEISQYASEEELLFRWTGFSDIEIVEITGSGRLMVLEGGGARFVEFDRSGTVHLAGSFRQRNVFEGVAWLVFGLMGGWGLFFFYSARVAVLSVVVAGALLSLRSAQVTIRRWYGPLLLLVAFAITVVPMVPYWRSHPGAFSHRMDTSFSLYDPRTGFHPQVLARALGKPFLNTLGMFFTETDASSQGTLSPGVMPIQAALLVIGLAAVLTDGWCGNIACLGWFVTMLLRCVSGVSS